MALRDCPQETEGHHQEYQWASCLLFAVSCCLLSRGQHAQLDCQSDATRSELRTVRVRVGTFSLPFTKRHSSKVSNSRGTYTARRDLPEPTGGVAIFVGGEAMVRQRIGKGRDRDSSPTAIEPASQKANNCRKRNVRIATKPRTKYW